MATKVPPIGRPNYIAIAGMDRDDLIRVREYYILRIIAAKRTNDSDTLTAALEWLDALVSEMRLRGNAADAKAEQVLKVVA